MIMEKKMETTFLYNSVYIEGVRFRVFSLQGLVAAGVYRLGTAPTQ